MDAEEKKKNVSNASNASNSPGKMVFNTYKKLIEKKKGTNFSFKINKKK